MRTHHVIKSWAMMIYVPLLLALPGCKEEDATKPPAATTTQPANPYTTYTQAAGNTTTTNGTNTSAAAPTGSGRTGAGCGPADAEVVPNEAGLRECCRKIYPQMTACLASACWGPGFAAKLKTHMVAGGRCAQ
jgi:hypothetical protein